MGSQFKESIGKTIVLSVFRVQVRLVESVGVLPLLASMSYSTKHASLFPARCLPHAEAQA